MHHRFRYKTFSTTNHLVTINLFFTWGGINFLNGVPPIITSPNYGISPEKPPSDDGFIKSLWSYLIDILISNLYIYIYKLHLLYDI